MLGHLDFEAGTWHAEVYFSEYDLPRLPTRIPKSLCLRSCDMAALRDMRSEWEVNNPTGGDMATPTSIIVFYYNGIPVWESFIHITDRVEGFQSRSFGWVEPLRQGIMSEHLSRFEPCSGRPQLELEDP
jgi:hypothetical protein